jgi:hypothetical protein
MQSSYSYIVKYYVQMTTVFRLPKIISVEARKYYFENTAIAVTGSLIDLPHPPLALKKTVTRGVTKPSP